MYEILIGLIILSAVLYLTFAIFFNNNLIKYILKPGTMFLIIVLAIYGSELNSFYSYLIVSALILSLFGDIFLMLSDKWFVHGLVSFLLGHILYIIAFVYGYSYSFTSDTLIVIGSLLLIAVLFFCILFKGVKKEGGPPLLIAVAFYITVISTMLGLSILTGNKILMIAALLFFISDGVLAINKFNKQFKLADYVVMSTYFTAQLLFAISLGGHI
ncbi:lysoplasmalogenase [Ornithinibacillus sp. 179-J 7C1 HS]|uniref:lysoplasmalogenase n=1 Tax=Ornithinibacillus sp. 179-J 7C1 HS TaxID=3142384 RepID=UPI0039A1274C